MKSTKAIGVFAFFTVFLILSTSSPAQVKIKSYQFDQTNITVGDPIQLKLVIETSPSFEIRLGTLDLRNKPHIEANLPIVKRLVSNSQVEKAIYEATYEIRAFSVGEHELPPLTIEIEDKGGKETQLETPAYSFKVKKTKPNDAIEIQPIKPPLTPDVNWVSKILLILFLMLIVTIGISFYKLRRSQVINEPIETRRKQPAHEIAHQHLNKIEQKRLIETGKIKMYHTEVADATRCYITDRFGITASELTTRDLLQKLSTQEEISIEQFQMIGNFFKNCDLVKFAKNQPNKAESRIRMTEIREFVENTKQLLTNSTD
ncbi:MAG: hypothetical protein VX901_06200 [Candidatus Poribacteria bacterium]|nr:hypothetical protein [Candidatus Poribacteria bacterium]